MHFVDLNRKINRSWKAFIQSATEIDSYCLVLIFFSLLLFFSFSCVCVCVRYRKSLSSCELLSFSGLPRLSLSLPRLFKLNFISTAGFYLPFIHIHIHTFDADFLTTLISTSDYSCHSISIAINQLPLQSTIFFFGAWFDSLRLA